LPGTWIPLHDGRALAERNGVLEKLLAIFDFVPGDRSPPPAPKHATAASNRPRVPRQPAAGRRAAQQPGISPAKKAAANKKLKMSATASQLSTDDRYDVASVGQYAEEETPDNVTTISDSMMDDDPYSQYPGSKKRKRGADQMSVQDQQHQIWADQLLDYFMLLDTEDNFPHPPEPPPGIDLERPIDEKGHSALHWAAAMGDIEVVRDLISRGAKLDSLSNNLETPLMRAVMFTNNYDKNTMGKLIRILAPTVQRTDWFDSTVFHHIAATTSSKNKYQSARYYMDTIINLLLEIWIPTEVTRLLDAQDKNRDTAVMIAARHGARKCVRSLLGRSVQVDQPNAAGETADDLIRDLNARRRYHQGPRNGSSSPGFETGGRGLNGDSASVLSRGGPVQVPGPQIKSQSAHTLLNRIAPSIQDRCKQLALAYDAEYEIKVEEEIEIERVMQKRTSEVEALKIAVADLKPMENELDSLDPEEEAREEQELRRLEQEAEAILEVENRDDLRSQISRPNLSNNALAPPPIPSHGNGVADQRNLANKLKIAMSERQRLVRDIVGGMSTAGLGEKQEGYKRLIKGAIGVNPNEIEGMLDEVLRELEEAARERVAMEEG
jgi:transcription factor MBP1